MLFYSLSSPAQTVYLPTGAEAIALGDASTTLSSPFASGNNMAGIASLQGLYAGTSYQRIGLPGMGSFFAFGLYGGEKWSGALSIHHFGDPTFQQSTVSASAASRFGIAQIGVRLNAVQYAVASVGSKTVMTADVGGITQLGKKLKIGAVILNANQARLSKEFDERVPTILKVGLSLKPVKALTFCLEAEKSLRYKTLFKTGMEYQFLPHFKAAVGLQSVTHGIFGGLSFQKWGFGLQYAFMHYPSRQLGHAVSLVYKFSHYAH